MQAGICKTKVYTVCYTRYEMVMSKTQNIPMPSRIDRFGLIMSLEFTRNISPMYRWFVGTKTLHNSSSSLSLCNQQPTNVTKDKEPERWLLMWTRKKLYYLQVTSHVKVKQTLLQEKIHHNTTSTWRMTVDVIKPNAYSPTRGWRIIATSLKAVVFWSVRMYRFKSVQATYPIPFKATLSKSHNSYRTFHDVNKIENS